MHLVLFITFRDAQAINSAPMQQAVQPERSPKTTEDSTVLCSEHRESPRTRSQAHLGPDQDTRRDGWLHLAKGVAVVRSLKTITIKRVNSFADRAQAFPITAWIHPEQTWTFMFLPHSASSINDILLNLFLLVKFGAISRASNKSRNNDQ